MDWSDIGGMVLSQVIPVIGAVLAGLFSWGLNYVIRKWKLDWLAAHEGAIRSSVRSAIHGAEEWAARKAKTEVDVSGEEKAKLVHGWLSKKYPELLPDDLDRYIDEELGMSTHGASLPPELAGLPSDGA